MTSLEGFQVQQSYRQRNLQFVISDARTGNLNRKLQDAYQCRIVIKYTFDGRPERMDTITLHLPAETERKQASIIPVPKRITLPISGHGTIKKTQDNVTPPYKKQPLPLKITPSNAPEISRKARTFS